MYTSLSIKNFRAFQTLEIEGLKRVNLFTGRNNSGKTSVLEAVYLLEGQFPAARARQLFRNRGLADAGIIPETALEMPWATLFRNLAVETDIELRALKAGVEQSVRLTTKSEGRINELLSAARDFSPNPFTKNMVVGYRDSTRKDMVFVQEREIRNFGGDDSFLNLRSYLLSVGRRGQQDLVAQFGALAVEKLDGLVTDALRIVEPRLRRLSTVLSGGAPLLHADLDGADRLLPFAVVGDGMIRLLEIVLAMLQCRGQVLLVDEIENGFHYSAFTKVWELIHELAKQYNVQVFAVTHSHECAIAAHEAAKSSDYDFQYFRMEQADGIGRAFPFEREAMQSAIDVELEIR